MSTHKDPNTTTTRKQPKKTTREKEQVPGMGTKLVTNINKAHQVFGHIGSDVVRASCKHLGWKLVKKASTPCASCAVAKMKRKPSYPPKDTSLGIKILAEDCS